MKLSELTKEELKILKDECNFNSEQEKIFNLLSTGDYSDFAIRQKLYMSNANYYRIKKVIKEKIGRVSGECLIYSKVYWKYA